MDKNIKAVSVSRANGIRYVIISAETGEVLDDAQGYGYKTPQKAYSAYAYKTRDRAKDAGKKARERLVRKWLREHKGFVNAMDETAFEIAKGSWGPKDEFSAKVVSELLDSFGLKPEFTAAEILRVWRKG